MNPATMEFLKARFSGYYRTNQIFAPPALEQREWGFVFFDPSGEVRMRRHISFGSREELTEYIRTMVPAHIYYSTAYYALPSAATMKDKIWTGADLIFDLDADHIMRGPYDVMLSRVKEEAYKLLDMLIIELGFSKKEISIVFSGGRGYHIHIRNITFREWGSAERREIVDYVCGTGIDPQVMLRARNGGGTGWPSRFRKALMDELEELNAMEKSAALSYLKGMEGVGDKSAEHFLEGIGEFMTQLRDPACEVPANDRVMKAMVGDEEGKLRERIREMAALTDEPVTTDIKRLIRLPGSLHGGSGFRVTPLTVKELDNFDPLIDAVVFGTGKVNIHIPVSVPYPVPLLGNTYMLKKGTNRVPEALAVFLCCRGIGEMPAGRC
jgi:DNA primase small subunit